MDLQQKPCIRCGATDRNPSGKCRPCKRELNRAYREAHKDESRRRLREWKEANREQVRKVSRDWYAKQRQDGLDLLGRACACPGCPVTLDVFLSLDHINGGGGKHRALYGQKGHRHGGKPTSVWRDVLAHPDPKSEFQTLCHNCNQAKHITKGEHTCLDL